MLFFIVMVVVIIIASMCIIDKFDSADLNVVDHNYANDAIKFFNSYLSLCKNHSVRGICDTKVKSEVG